MGGSPSCDEAGECAVRACQFSKHSNTDISHGQGIAEITTKFNRDVDGTLDTFFNENAAANRTNIDNLKDAIIGDSTANMDIGVSCIGFTDATKENFTRTDSSSSLIACVVICITLAVAFMIAWRIYFCKRNRPTDTIKQSSTRTAEESTNDLR